MLNLPMLKSYFNTTIRNLYREKVYAVINILGLSLAVSCCLIVALYIRSELTFDQHNENYENIYRVTVDFTSDGGTNRWAVNSLALPPLLKNKYPDIGEFVRFTVGARSIFKYEGTEIYWDDVLYTDINVFDVFSHTAIYGELKNSLQDPSSIAISESFSKSYFGDRNPIGETISTDGQDFIVSVVFSDLPENSHLKYSALISMNLYHDVYGLRDNDVTPKNLFFINSYSYFLLSEQTSQDEFQILLDTFYQQEVAEIGKEYGMKGKYHIQKLEDIHFNSGLKGDKPTGNIFYVFSFIAAGLFVLLVAVINYTNLAIARTTMRSKEVGMRKVIGAERYQLIIQFMGESFFYVFSAIILGLVFAEIIESQTSIASLMGKKVLLNLALEPEILLWITGGGVVIALLAGVYPAIYLSSIQPISAITAHKTARGSRIQVRRVLVFLQFFVSVTVLACSLILQEQMHYVANKPLGFDKENKIAVMIKGTEALSKLLLIKNELLKNDNILEISISSHAPGNNLGMYNMKVENNNNQMEDIGLSSMGVDKGFIDLMDINIIEGVGFNKHFSTDGVSAVVVNETLVEKMGWDVALGKRVEVGSTSTRVIGVMEDVHFAPLHEVIEPFLLWPMGKLDISKVELKRRALIYRWMIINIAGENTRHSVDHIGSVMSKFDTKHPFEYKFIDALLNEHYQSEVDLMNLTSIFSMICLFISCMGLYGLTAFTTGQRTKEIGIRKVLGASTLQIVLMLTKKIIYMVFVAAVFASAISFYIMDSFLESFAYRAEMGSWVFVLASFVVAVVAVATVTAQSFKVAQSNPVESLRYE